MSTIDDKKNGREPIVYGDVKAFVVETVTYIVYVVLWGIGGAFLYTLVKSVGTDYKGQSMADIILPTDLNGPPYTTTNKQPVSLKDIIHNEGVDKFRAMLEWIWPMEHASFPYNIDDSDTPMNDISKLWNGFIQWLVNSCSYTFSTYRRVYKFMLTILFFILNLSESFGGMFIFYLGPIFMLYLSFIPSIVPIGMFLSFVGAIIGKNYKEGLYWVFAPMAVVLFGISEIIKSPANFFNFTLMFTLIALFYISWCIMPIAFMWYFCISVALWIYAIFFFICSPLTQEKGLDTIKEAIGLHWKGLTFIFLALVTKSALINLSATLSTGVIAGTILSLFLLYRA